MATLLSSLNTARPINGELEKLLEAAVARLQAGQAVDLDALAAAHPQHAEALRELLPAIELLHRMGDGGADVAAELSGDGCFPSPAAGVPASYRQLGDFRIIRELGRGGMGTVFEAEQLSMGRRVALKVLPFAALAQEKSLQRFRNEVRAAAALDHPHIVSVYSVGEERGIHYFAMQLIRGQTLAEIIAELRQSPPPLKGGARGGIPEERLAAGVHAENGAVAGNPSPVPSLPGRGAGTDAPPAPDSAPHAGASTAANSRAAAECSRTVARLGIQAAEALQHAHDQGVLHRDIKPGNLMLDSNGKLYITDFGLARIEADAGLTMTGDIIGTLRYMAPEQALAKRVVIDQRADVYSLGATLYELLTLEPAFAETDRSELLKQIAFAEPRPPRKVDRRISLDMDTIVLKAMAKHPNDRHENAQRLADDLQAFLSNRPIKAKPPAMHAHIAKWCRRHPTAAMIAALSFAITSAVLTIAGILISRGRNSAIEARNQAVENLRLAKVTLGGFLEHRVKFDNARRLSDKGYPAAAAELAAEGCELLRTMLFEVSQSEIGVTAELLHALRLDCQLLFESGFPQESAEFLREYLRLLTAKSNESPLSRKCLSLLAFELVNWPQSEIRDGIRAKALIQRAIALSRSRDPDAENVAEWQVYGNLAFAHLRCGDYQEAINIMHKSIQLGEAVDRPPSGMDWLMLALAHSKRGEQVESIRWFEKAVALLEKDDYLTETPLTDRGSFYERHFYREVQSHLNPRSSKSSESQATPEAVETDLKSKELTTQS